MGSWTARLAPVCGVLLVALIPGVAARARAVSGQDGTAAGAAVVDELFAEGQVVFGTNCVSCHDAAGGDGQAPALSGHPSMGARDHIVRQILQGNLQKGMPAFGAQLNDRQVAAVATYIRMAWDNAHGVVLEADVKKVRDEAKAD
jgi:mono/diheme cytochrome c family protein